MTQRKDYKTAEKMSLALLTRAAFGTAAGLKTAARSGLPLALAEKVFARYVVYTRIEIDGFGPKIDRRAGPRATTSR